MIDNDDTLPMPEVIYAGRSNNTRNHDTGLPEPDFLWLSYEQVYEGYPPYTRYVRADLAETRADDGWRLIESAPKDGTLIDLFTEGGFRFPSCRWNPSYNPGYEEDGLGFWEELVSGTVDKFTGIGPYGCSDDDFSHWQPLPAPPQTPEDKP